MKYASATQYIKRFAQQPYHNSCIAIAKMTLDDGTEQAFCFGWGVILLGGILAAHQCGWYKRITDHDLSDPELDPVIRDTLLELDWQVSIPRGSTLAHSIFPYIAQQGLDCSCYRAHLLASHRPWFW